MIAIIFLFSFFLTTGAHLPAQEKISLTDVEKVKDYLLLNESQYNSIIKIVKEIELILAEDNKIISELKERIKNDDEPGFFEKIKVKNGRDERRSRIKDLIREAEGQLSRDQKEKFKRINKPELRSLRKEEIFGSEK